MTEAFAIKPCPFCGDDYDKGSMEMFAPQTGAKWKKITCRLCGASAPDTVWNQRVTVSEKGEQDADALLREALDAYDHIEMSAQETSLEFVERMERLLPTDIPHHQLQAEQDARQLLKLAKTAALIEEHRLQLLNGQNGSDYRVISATANYAHHGDLHIAVRAVADKIKEAS